MQWLAGCTARTEIQHSATVSRSYPGSGRVVCLGRTGQRASPDAMGNQMHGTSIFEVDDGLLAIFASFFSLIPFVPTFPHFFSVFPKCSPTCSHFFLAVDICYHFFTFSPVFPIVPIYYHFSLGFRICSQLFALVPNFSRLFPAIPICSHFSPIFPSSKLICWGLNPQMRRRAGAGILRAGLARAQARRKTKPQPSQRFSAREGRQECSSGSARFPVMFGTGLGIT